MSAVATGPERRGANHKRDVLIARQASAGSLPPLRPSTAPAQRRTRELLLAALREPTSADLVELRRLKDPSSLPRSRLCGHRPFPAAAGHLPLGQLLTDPTTSASSCPATHRGCGIADAPSLVAAGEAAVKRALEEAKGHPAAAACKVIRGLMLDRQWHAGERHQMQFVLTVLESAGGIRRPADLEPVPHEDIDVGAREYIAMFFQPRGTRKRTLRQVVQTIVFASRLWTRARMGSCHSGGSADNLLVSHFFGGEVSSERLQFQLDHIDSIQDFNIFQMAELTGQQPLLCVGLHIMQKRKLLREFNLSANRFTKFLTELEAQYQNNPYHNRLHAAEVAQTAHSFLLGSRTQWSELEIISTLVAAMVHDVAHPGVTNAFRIMVRDEDAITYNDRSVNESMHSAVAFRLAQKEGCDWMTPFSNGQFSSVRKCMIDIVLHTDMALHSVVLGAYRTASENGVRDVSKWDNPTLALQWITHAADISSTTKPFDIAEQWTTRLQDEFFAQGDRERDLGLPLSPLCDRNSFNRVTSQLGFVNFIVKPSFLALQATTIVDESIENIEAYLERYGRRLQEQKLAGQ